MKPMLKINRFCIATILVLGAGVPATAQALLSGAFDDVESSFVRSPYKGKQTTITGAGQITSGGPTTLIYAFTGTGTHIGDYSCVAYFDTTTGQVNGTFVTVRGDVLHWYSMLGPGGTFPGVIGFAGGTGRFVGATGSVAGFAQVNQDLSFTFEWIGVIAFSR